MRSFIRSNFIAGLGLCSLVAACDGGGADEIPSPPAPEALAVHIAPAPQRVTKAQLARLATARLEAGPSAQPELDERGLPAIDVRESRPIAIAASTASDDLVTITSPLPAGTPGALPVCTIDFNSQWGIARMADQAYTTFTSAPHYQHWCNNSSYLVLTWPLNISHYHLGPEAANTCTGTSPNIGIKSGAQCINQKEGKLWPRVATNMGGNSGVEFWVKSAGNVPKNFDLKSLTVKGGSVEVWVATNTGWWMWTGLGPGYWEFPQGDMIGDLRLFASGMNGTISYDNIQIAVIP